MVIRDEFIETLLERLRGASSGLPYTVALATGLVLAFAYATYLSYWGGKSVSNAFAYQTSVVAAQRDAELLEVEQFDRKAPAEQLRSYKKLLDSDLSLIDAGAESLEERAPPFHFPAQRGDYARLSGQLHVLEDLGTQRFQSAVDGNVRTRNLSNGMFAIVALFFTLFQARLRKRIEEGRTLVENLQRAFISRRMELPNIGLGSVLISATEGAQIGGDLFDVYNIDGRHGSFLVADVSGKGVAAAVDTAFIKYAIRTLLSELRDPAEVLTRFAALYDRNAESEDTFVVLFLGVVDTETGEVRFASAGHEPAWARMGKSIRILPPTGPLVGVMPDAVYGSSTLQLSAGDAIIVSTDGLTESRDARGRMLDADGVRSWLEDIEGGAQATAEAIVRRLRKRSARIDDDLAILVVRYDPRRKRGAASPEAMLVGGS